MKFTHILNRIKNRLFPEPVYNERTHLWEVKKFGHIKSYDFENFLVSDSVHHRNYSATNIFMPGTLGSSLRKYLFTRCVYDTTGKLKCQFWYNRTGDVMALAIPSEPDKIVLAQKHKVSRVINRADFDKAIDPIIHIIKSRTYIVNVDLREISHRLYHAMEDVLQNAPNFTPIKHDKSEEIANVVETPSVVKETSNPIFIKPVAEPAPYLTVKPTFARPKLTPEERHARWTEQLKKRKEKHAILMAAKEKVLASKRIKPEKKAERLASLNKRLMHNERAQHMLQTRLKAIETLQKRDELKRTTKEHYQQVSARLKQKRTEFKATKEVLSKDELAWCRKDFKKTVAEKKQAFAEYRAAQRSAKKSTIVARKLKSRKRQRTIFDLARIVREKDLLERSLKIEKDTLTQYEMTCKLESLRLQKKTLLEDFKKITAPKTIHVAEMTRPVQPILQHIEQNSQK